ncbi:hypothetical protein KY285_030384 [Solanum tuberosum]|nr:hypothetical protein KY285_030384 [Solanum tuberosum]
MLMRGHNLFGHLDGSSPTPSTTITQNNREVARQAYSLWFHQDQLIHNTIMASVDLTIAASIAAASSAKPAWDSLHLAYANKSQTCIFSLRDQLSHLSKDSRPIGDYLHQVRSLCNELTTAGATTTKDELVVKILSGHGIDIHELFAAIQARDLSSRLMKFMGN